VIMVEERRRKKTGRTERRERMSRGARVEEEEGEGGGLASNYLNAPPSLFLFIFVPSCSILGTASLIRNPSSKLKIDNTTFHRLLIPKNI